MQRIITAAALAASLLAAPAARAAWTPPQRLTWYWQLQGTVAAPAGADAVDVDGFDTSAQQVAALRARGHHSVCYFSAGTWEDWRPDADRFPADVKGRGNGWPGEKWLDIRADSVRQVMVQRIDMCASKGFDAVEPDNVDGFTNATGFQLTAADQLDFNRWLAAEAHARGLAALQKNDAEQAAELQPDFDGALTEECFSYRECAAFDPYLAAGKPVLEAEYGSPSAQACRQAGEAGRMAAYFDTELDGRTYAPCWT